MSNRVERRWCGSYSRTDGQSLVEAALILPVLSLLFIGLIEFSFMLYAHIQVANAAREAARAASLYNSTRYSSWSDGSTPKKCEGTIAGWSLNQTVQQAIVYRSVPTTGSTSGCPDASGSIVYTSLGRLDPSLAFTATISPAQSTYYNATTNSDSSPPPGTTGTVSLTYSYQLPIVSNLIPYLNNPILIQKSVQFEYQQ